MDIFVLVISLICLVTIVKPFTFPGESSFEDAGSTLALLLGGLAYFYGVDLFPPTSFLAPLHLITIGLVNAFSIVDLFVLTLLGTPLTLHLIFVVMIPAMIIFRFAKFLLSYVALFSEVTQNFFASILAFLSMVAAVKGEFNLVQIAIGALVYLISLITGQNTIYLMTVAVMVGCVIFLAIAVSFEVMTLNFVSQLTEGMQED